MMKSNILNLKSLFYLLLLFSISSCSNNQTNQKQALKHLVFFQFKAEATEEMKNEAVQIFLDLEDKIPEIQKIEGGENISDKELNKGFTHCFILTFENEAARDIYLPHPEHVRVVEANKPVLSDLLVVDVWGEE